MIRTRVFNTVAALSIFVLASAALHAQQATQEQLSQRQLKALIATAKTPAEHERIARYYQAQAQGYQTLAQEHEAMLATFRANPTLNTEKTQYGTVKHCEYFVKSSKKHADKALALAQKHEEMARAAEPK